MVSMADSDKALRQKIIDRLNVEAVLAAAQARVAREEEARARNEMSL